MQTGISTLRNGEGNRRIRISGTRKYQQPSGGSAREKSHDVLLMSTFRTLLRLKVSVGPPYSKAVPTLELSLSRIKRSIALRSTKTVKSVSGPGGLETVLSSLNSTTARATCLKEGFGIHFDGVDAFRVGIASSGISAWGDSKHDIRWSCLHARDGSS
jgi:hypothetical protein